MCVQNKHEVDVTSQLDLQPYCSKADEASAQKPLYRLISTIHHYGQGIHVDGVPQKGDEAKGNKAKSDNGQTVGGHYTALCRTNDGKWFECNDSRVTKCNSVEGPSSLAYLLFFRRQG